MKIEKDKLVQIHYTLTNKEGKELDSSRTVGQPLEYIHGHRYLIQGLEDQLEGKEQGDKFIAEVKAADAYGEYDERLVIDIPREQFADGIEIKPGMQFQGQSAMGPTIVTVKEVGPDTVKVDANHELAGQDLTFDVEVVLVRDMTEDEVKQMEAAMSGCGGGCGGCGGGCGSSEGCGSEGSCGCGGGCGSGGCGCN